MTAAVITSERQGPHARPVLQLAAHESLRMVRHPAFVAGLVLSVWSTWSALHAEESWIGQGYYAAMTAWMWAYVGTLVAVACVAGRNRWIGAPDQFPATPMTAAGRVTAHAIAVVAPVAVVTTAVAASAWAVAASGGFGLGVATLSEPVDPPPVQWVQIPILTALAGSVGLALTQLRRGRLVALTVVSAITALGAIAPWMYSVHPFRVLAPFMFPAYESRVARDLALDQQPGDPPVLAPAEFAMFWREVRFDSSALWWHLGYVVGLVALLVWLAVRRAGDGRPPRTWPAVGAVAMITICGIAQVLTAEHG